MVPEHLVPLLKRKNLTKRLGTKSIAEAKSQAPEHVEKFQKIIADAALLSHGAVEPVDIIATLQALDAWMAHERGRLLPAAFAAGRSGPLDLDFEWKLAYRRVGDDYFPGQALVDPDDCKLLAALASIGALLPAGTSVPDSLRSEFARSCAQVGR